MAHGPPRPSRTPRDIAYDFVKASGFPQEVRVVDAFNAAGFTPFPSVVYDDPTSGDVGEIDILAFREVQVPGASFRFSCTVECKQSVAIPWLLFRSPPGGLGGFVHPQRHAPDV